MVLVDVNKKRREEIKDSRTTREVIARHVISKTDTLPNHIGVALQ